MSVANVSDASQGLTQYFQRLAADRAQQPASGDGAGSAQSAQVAQQPHRHHRGGGGGGELRGKIESAVTTALQNYTGDGDVHQVVQEAIKTAIAGGASSADTPTAQASNPSDPATAAAQWS